MKLFLNDKTPVLTAEAEPSLNCTKTCCFFRLRFRELSCGHFIKQCTERYSYSLQNKVEDIFKL